MLLVMFLIDSNGLCTLLSEAQNLSVRKNICGFMQGVFFLYRGGRHLHLLSISRFIPVYSLPYCTIMLYICFNLKPVSTKTT